MPKHLDGVVIGVDFDGTVVTKNYPYIGKSIGAEQYLIQFIEDGAKIVLWTVRDGVELDDAVKWYSDRNINLYGINKNLAQEELSNSPKAHCHIYIDDQAIGVPLKIDYKLSDYPFVDWERVYQIVYERMKFAVDLKIRKKKEHIC